MNSQCSPRNDGVRLSQPTHCDVIFTLGVARWAVLRFTCGRFGAGGGLTDPHPPGDDLDHLAEEDGTLHVLPFTKGEGVSDEHYAESRSDGDAPGTVIRAMTLPEDLGGGSDVWTIGARVALPFIRRYALCPTRPRVRRHCSRISSWPSR